MRYGITVVLMCLATLAGCTTIGFDPAHDAALARTRATAPQIQAPADLRKQDPRESLRLDSYPKVVSGYMVLTVPVVGQHRELDREIVDPRQTFPKKVATEMMVTAEGKISFMLQCKSAKSDCTDLDDVATVTVPLHRKVWRTGVYGTDGRLERVYNNAVYRPALRRFAVLFSLDEWTSVVGKHVCVLSAYGDWCITRDGQSHRLEEGGVATLPPGVARLPVQFGDPGVVWMARDEPAGKYFLSVIASEFPLPAPFYSGAAHPDLYLGAMRLTRQENIGDCWASHGRGGVIVITPIPAQTITTFVVSLLWDIPRIASRDCGVHQMKGKDESKEATPSGSLPSDPSQNL